MLLPSDVQTTDATHPILSYLAPAPVEAMLVAWQIAPPQQALITWRATIPAPPTRDGVFALITCRSRTYSQPICLAANLPPGSGKQYQCSSAHADASRYPSATGHLAVVVPTIAELHPRFQAHDNRTFSLSVPADSSQRSVLLIIGTEQFRMSPTMKGGVYRTPSSPDRNPCQSYKEAPLWPLPLPPCHIQGQLTPLAVPLAITGVICWGDRLPGYPVFARMGARNEGLLQESPDRCRHHRLPARHHHCLWSYRTSGVGRSRVGRALSHSTPGEPISTP